MTIQTSCSGGPVFARAPVSPAADDAMLTEGFGAVVAVTVGVVPEVAVVAGDELVDDVELVEVLTAAAAMVNGAEKTFGAVNRY